MEQHPRAWVTIFVAIIGLLGTIIIAASPCNVPIVRNIVDCNEEPASSATASAPSEASSSGAAPEKLQDQVAIMSLKYPLVQNMKALRPNWPSGVLAATSLGDLTRLDGDFLAVSAAQATSRLVRAANAANKELLVWTVNDPVRMSAMITLGVDGLITDEPALAISVLEQRADMNIAEKMTLFLSDKLGLKLNTGEYRDASP